MAESKIINLSKTWHLIDTISLNEDVQIPPSATNIAVQLLLNNGVASPIQEINQSDNRLTFALGTWLGTERITINNGVVSWTDETTIIGTKSSSWTITAKVLFK